MSAQRGKDLLIKLGDAGSPETFTTVAGLRTTSLAFNAQTVDVTNADSTAPWRELLENAGVRSAAVSGSGVFKDAASDATVRSVFFAGSLRNWQIVVPGFGTIAGAFDLTSLQYDASYDGEVKVSLTLASAGALSFTPI